MASGLRGYLGDQELPLVLVGLDYLAGAYKSVNSYRYLTQRVVRENPDQLSAEELHALAWPITRSSSGSRRRATSSVGARGIERASSDPRDIEAGLMAGADWTTWPGSIVTVASASARASAPLYN